MCQVVVLHSQFSVLDLVIAEVHFYGYNVSDSDLFFFWVLSILRGAEIASLGVMHCVSY